MPNWCSNTLTVAGDKEELKKFKELSLLKDEDGRDNFTLAGTFPEPDYETTPVAQTYPQISASFTKTEEQKAIILENKPTIRKDSWWDWRVQNWGTKWDVGYANIYIDEDTEIQLSFATAWSPPSEWLKHIFSDFPLLRFELEYEELGMMFGGVIDADEQGYHNHSYDLECASDCCKAETYWEDDEEFSLKEGEGEYQCSKCKEECETEYINAMDIKK